MIQGGAKQHNEMLALALEPTILVNSTGMNWQCIYLPLKSHVVDVGNHAGDVAVESYW
jgi:hypothetical protein